MKYFIIVLFIILSVLNINSAADLDSFYSGFPPIFEYQNWGAYLYVENDSLFILEYIKNDNNKKTCNNFFIKKELILDQVIFIKNIEIIDTVDDSFIDNIIYKPMFEKGKNKIIDKYNNSDLIIEYNNTHPFNQLIIISVKKNDKLVKIIETQSFYIFHKIYKDYLILAQHSQGGSGHTIYIEIYDLKSIK